MKTLLAPFFAACLMCMYGCSPTMYSNVSYNAPLFHKQGEVNITAGYSESHNPSTGEFGEGIALGFATSASDHTVLTASYLNHSNNNNDGNNWNGKGSYVELGVGCYTVFGNEEMGAAEIIGGVGYMTIKNNRESEYIDTHLLKTYIQPTIGISHKVIDVAFTPRISYISYLYSDYQLIDASEQFEVRNFFYKKKNTLVLEPGITIRLGYKYVKVDFQYGSSSFSYQSSNVEDFEPYYSRYIHLGLNFLITDRFLLPEKDE